MTASTTTRRLEAREFDSSAAAYFAAGKRPEEFTSFEIAESTVIGFAVLTPGGLTFAGADKPRKYYVVVLAPGVYLA